MSGDVTVHHGDALEVLATMPDASVDAVCTDPPYGLEFMGKNWDSFQASGRTNFAGGGPSKMLAELGFTPPPRYVAGVTFQQWCEQWAGECLRLLKPGGHLLAFGGTRTFHRLACAIEDAGFEIRDTISWLYGSGFPKSLDVSKAIDQAAGAEREVVATIPDRWAGKGDVLQRATQAEAESVNITAPATDDARRWQGWGTALKPAWEPIIVARKPLAGTVAANVLAHGTGALNIDGCRIGDEIRLNPAAGNKPGGSSLHMSAVGMPQDVEGRNAAGRWPANVVLDEDAAAQLDRQSGITSSNARQAKGTGMGYHGANGHRGAWSVDDVGGASRFYYTAKAAPDERPRVNGISHPTVKPLDLMRWLVRLGTPRGGLVLDPFAGSGTTGEACIVEGFRCVLIEREADYLPLIHARLSKPIQPTLGATQ